jgi:hypothetical protein
MNRKVVIRQVRVNEGSVGTTRRVRLWPGKRWLVRYVGEWFVSGMSCQVRVGRGQSLRWAAV